MTDTGKVDGMSETSYALDRDLREAEAMANGLIPYVHEDRLYGSVGSGGLFGGGTMPSLTIGALLMRLRRLHALEATLNDAQRAKLAQIDAKHDEARREWTLHYTEKLEQEAKSRLKAMNAFFEECEDSLRICRNNYQPETLRRTIVHDIDEVLTELGEHSEDLDRALRTVDNKLRRYTEASDFVWAKELEPAYPRDEYWWLYAMPPKPDDNT